MANKIKKGDTVKVVSGRDKGKTGRVTRVIPQKNRLIVEGVNSLTRHVGNRQGVRQTGRIRVDGPVHISNVAYVDADTGVAGRVGWKKINDGSRIRVVKNAKK